MPIILKKIEKVRMLLFYYCWRCLFPAAPLPSDNNAGTLVVLNQGRCKSVSKYEDIALIALAGHVVDAHCIGHEGGSLPEVLHPGLNCVAASKKYYTVNDVLFNPLKYGLSPNAPHLMS